MYHYALSVLITGEWTSGATNATLALNVFQNNLGFFGTVFMTATMVIFSVTTSGGWYVYYEATLRHLAMNHPTVKKWLLRMFKYFYALPPFLLTLYLIHVGDLSIWTWWTSPAVSQLHQCVRGSYTVRHIFQASEGLQGPLYEHRNTGG